MQRQMFAYPDFTADCSLCSHSPLVFVVIVVNLQAWMCLVNRVSTPTECTPDVCIAASSTQPKFGTSLLMFAISRTQRARLVLEFMIAFSIPLSSDKLSRSVLCPAYLTLEISGASEIEFSFPESTVLPLLFRWTVLSEFSWVGRVATLKIWDPRFILKNSLIISG